MAKAPAKPKKAKAPASRSPLTDEQWEAVKVAYESDPAATFRSLARIFPASHQTIQRQCRKDKWTKVVSTDVADKAEAAADAKSADIEAPAPPAPTEPDMVSVSAAVAKRAEVIDRHRRELNLPRNRLYAALQANDFDKMKQAKISAETLAILQAAERKAWGLDGSPTLRVIVDRSEKWD